MPELTRSFLSGVMNKDVDERILRDGQFRDALNIDVVHSEGEDAGTARNMKGNTKLGDLSNVTGQPVDSSTRTIGATVSEANNLIYYLVASDYFDGVFEYSELTDTITRVLQSNKATPSTPSKLNFDKDYYVTGINYIDGFLKWTDDLNEPCSINVARAKSYNIDDSRIEEDLRVIRSAPTQAAMIDMLEETGQENNMEESFFQFSYRWKYVDNQYSAMAPFSGTAFVPDNYFLDYGAGENKSMLNTKNKVKVSFQTGGVFVEEIELLVRDARSLNVSVVESFNKEQLNLADNAVHDFDFANSKIYRPLEADQLPRLFDNVPLKAKAQEVIDRRLVYGNYVQFYDIVDDLGAEIKIDFDLDFVNKWWIDGDIPLQTFRSDRDYEAGIIYGDDDGRVTTVLSSENNNTYIPPSFSVTANSLFVEINNKPPSFATNYRVVIKQSKKEYYNVFPILYYASGMYRYFLVNDFDKDKVRVGDYVIFKSDGKGPTQDNKKYKILEFDQKSSNFLNLGNTSELAGLYFKIKVDGFDEFSPEDLTTHEHTGSGTNYLSGGSAYQPPVEMRYAIAEDPIHYGDGPSGILTVVNNEYIDDSLGDKRLTVEIISQTEFRYTFDYTASSGWLTETLISGSPITLYNQSLPMVSVEWSAQVFYELGDKWKISCRSNGHLTGNYFGGVGIPDPGTALSSGDWGGAVILPGPSWQESAPGFQELDKAIEAGAVISIEVIRDSGNAIGQAGLQIFPPSPRRYENIEEWFVESGAYDLFVFNESVSGSGTDVGARAVTFRRGAFSQPFEYGWSAASFNWYNGPTSYKIYQGGTGFSGASVINSGLTSVTKKYPVHMIIQGYGIEFNGDSNVIEASINIQQLDNLAQCETVPKDADSEIYHETTRTYPIVNGNHTVLWNYLDFTFTTAGLIHGTQYTTLGQLDPDGDPNNIEGLQPHYFQVGDRIVISDSAGSVPNVAFNILAVPNKYNIVIDWPFPGSGPVTPGKVGFYHEQTSERDQVAAALPARLLINATHKGIPSDIDGLITGGFTPGNTNSTYNAYTYGNGLETDRIRDDFNSPNLEYSPRTNSAVEDYQQERKEASLTYSGVYRAETSVNGFNEFNLSNVNFKNLDLEFGSIQKLYARDTDLLVFQEDKVSRVLYGKNLLSDSTGGGSITSIPQVLGTQISYMGEWGISFNPESFAQWGNDLFWTDSRRGAVISITGSEIINISDAGMKDHFRDLMKDSPNTQKLGVYDPFKNHYIIASNDETSKPCSLSLTRDGKTFGSAGVKPSAIGIADFWVFSNTSWTASIVYSSGAGWVTGVPASGFGDQSIDLAVAANLTALNRTATITFTYCGGLTATFVVTQAAGTVGHTTWWVTNPIKPLTPTKV